eukprot:CAMPEP_0183795142 /NCGR_PEP_ID=MMETSP0803_2-20130417/4252_1 /TAXON_ID=195967 /ORGANISM="Crustomastix stigmata, Strain CCMP3273" /LENGTH=314 /DNA_ID=CAMNT_0026039553 /DNA_START=47 /DNA_END=991 /DNA_ORIENTATION=-
MAAFTARMTAHAAAAARRNGSTAPRRGATVRLNARSARDWRAGDSDGLMNGDLGDLGLGPNMGAGSGLVPGGAFPKGGGLVDPNMPMDDGGAGYGLEEKFVEEVMVKGYDPDGLFKAPETGHLQRRETAKRAETDKEFAEQQKELEKQEYQEMVARRAERNPPQDDPKGMVEFMLTTQVEDIPFEITRCRPLLDDMFFAEMKAQIQDLKFGNRPDETRLGELELMLQVCEGGVKDVDKNAEVLSAPADRLRKLLTAQDKKATLLEMVGNNEIDTAFLELLNQNIIGAKAAGNEQAAEFMHKLFEAAKKYSIVNV